jgi:drug/metabolite transporter (DMT)-like permease
MLQTVTSRCLPAVFVLLWSSGFLVGSVGAHHAPPLALTFWRFCLAAGVLAAIARATHAPWPRGRAAWRHVAITGVLLQAVQFSGVYLGLSLGVPAALSSLIMGGAPIVVAGGAVVLLGERLDRRRWLGSALGLAGVALAVAGGLGPRPIGPGVALTLLALAGLAGGTLYQRHAGANMDLRTGGAVQLGVAAVLVAPLAALHGGLAIPLTAPALGSLAWLALVNSIGALSIFYVLLRRRDAAGATSMLYLVPPLTAVLAALLLGQPLGAGVWAGLALATAGVALATRPPGSVRRPAAGAPAGPPTGPPPAPPAPCVRGARRPPCASATPPEAVRSQPV